MMKVFVWLCLSLICCSSSVNAEEIIWLGADFPPMSMSQGEYAHQGYIDALYAFLKSSLPQHKIDEQIVPWTRAMYMAQEGGPYCLISAFYTPERAKFLRFTEPYGYLLPLGLLLRADDKARFAQFMSEDGHIRLNDLLADEALVIGVTSDRSYGPLVDVLLKPLLSRDAPNVHKAYQNESTKFLVNMLNHKRFDYMLGYPSEAVFYASADNPLLFYQLAGNTQLLEGRLSCTKSSATDGVFSDVSRLVSSQATSATFLTAYERWLPKYLLGAYRQQLAARLKTQP